MNNNDDRMKKENPSKENESRPASPTSTTADNNSVQKPPTIEEATTKGEVDKLDADSNEDHKHTP